MLQEIMQNHSINAVEEPVEARCVCEVLDILIDGCCIHISNAPQDQITTTKKTSKDSEAIVAVLGPNWLGKVLMCFVFLCQEG